MVVTVIDVLNTTDTDIYEVQMKKGMIRMKVVQGDLANGKYLVLAHRTNVEDNLALGSVDFLQSVCATTQRDSTAR